MKVLRVITRLNIGGPAIHATLLNRYLETNRIQSILVTGHVDKEEGDMSYLLTESGRSPLTVPELRREIHLWRDLVSFWKLFRIMLRERPDIVHTHMAKAGTLGRLAATLARVPVRIHTFHGHVFEGYFDSFSARFFMTVERFLAKHSSCLIAVSNHVRTELCDRYRIDAGEKVRVIPLGLELEPFLRLEGREGHLRQELGLPQDTLLVGIVGRLVPVKNHTFFIDAAETLAQENENLHFVIVGGGEEEAFLRKFVQEKGLRGRVSFLGWRRDLPELYADLDIVVLTSRNEGTPVSLIEAMASAKPVIATRVGGVPDVIQEGTNGYMVEPGDLPLFIERTKHLLSHGALRKQMGEAGRAWVRDRYSKDRLLEEMRALYEELLNGKREKR
ncbi:MAG: glycosyltransferase family 4 protein [Candidatus Omnitrophota bacterium]